MIHPHPTHTPGLSRREALRRSSAVMAGALGLTSLGGLLAARSARAASSDYRALVCVFLYGGNDGNNTIVPLDATRYQQYLAVRQTLAIDQASLVPLAVRVGNDPAKPYGLHPSLAQLQPYWNNGTMAALFNVGVLSRPLTQAQYIAAPTGNNVPPSLFSHSDQQALWECGGVDFTSRTGWAGRASAALGTANPVISVATDGGRFGSESARSPLVLPQQPDTFGPMDLVGETFAPRVLRRAALDSLASAGRTHPMALRTEFSRQHRDAFALAEAAGAGGISLAQVIAAAPGTGVLGNQSAIDAAFLARGLIVNGVVQAGLAAQMYQLAKLISVNADGSAGLTGSRQIFLASLNGFDSHADQLPTATVASATHAELLLTVASALAAFQEAMVAIGLSEQVTTFTQSDFGRTFKPNKSVGTDHGWGNHHLILGGAVKGGLTYGNFPELALGGANDVTNIAADGKGRWIPTASVDQYAATLLRWFDPGLNLTSVLPNLSNFPTQTLGFL